MVEVIVTMRAREGKEDELEAFLLAIVVESRQEKGNLRYQLLIGDDDPREFAIHAQWENAAAATDMSSRSPSVFVGRTTPENRCLRKA